ncbi:hypothetical protein [Actinoplanes sp. NPDC051859]|uniref:hypothetical protein n=1 Tax=Actinoplanes sp. NPDC051859 TaxID=3363909 RepID=UPI0037A7DE36
MSGAALTISATALSISAGPAAASQRGTLASSVVASSQGVHVRGTCGDVFNPSASGGSAAWNLSCDPQGRIRITGWVHDYKADGKCAFVKAVAGNNETMPTAKACPKGVTTNFDWKTTGATGIINAYLYTA